MLWSERLDRLDLAIRAYEELGRREPRNMAVLDALARIHSRSGEAKELASVMKRMVMAEPSPPKQIDLLFRLGTLAEETLADKQLAAQCYGEVLARKPDDEDAIKFLGKVLTESERWPELASLIVREIQLADSNGRHEEMYDLMVRLGRLRLSRLRDPRGALDIFEDVLRRKQGHAGAIGALEEMARSDSPLRGEAAEALEPIFTSGGDHLRLVQMLESRASTEAVAEERAALLRKVAKLYAGPMQNADLAFVSASRALRELPDEEASLTLAVTLSDRASHGGEELAALLDEILPRASEDEARVAILRALGRAQERLGHRAEAVDAWRRVLETVPSDSEAMGCLVELYQAAGRAPELLEIYKRQLAISEDVAVRAALLFQVAELQDRALHDTVGAMATLRRLLELKPDDAQALEKLDALCEKQERWPELADVIGRRLALPGGDLDLDLRTRLAVVRETRLLDKYGALDLYGQVLTAQPKHSGALAQLEAWAQREPQNKPLVEVLLAAFRAAGRAGEAPRAHRAPRRRLGGPLRAQAAPGGAGQPAGDGEGPGRPLRRPVPGLPGGPERLCPPRPAEQGRRRGPHLRRARPAVRGGASPHRRDERTRRPCSSSWAASTSSISPTPPGPSRSWSAPASWTPRSRSPRSPPWPASTGRRGGATAWSRAWTSWRSSPRT